MRKISKKKYLKKVTRKSNKEIGHWEGKYFCSCMTRGYPKWLGLKRYGRDDIKDYYKEEAK